MLEKQWSEWYYKGIPAIGTYVQVKAHHKLSKEVEYFEGIIAGYNDAIVWFVGEQENDRSDWMADCWRELIPREFSYVSRKIEEPVDG